MESVPRGRKALEALPFSQQRDAYRGLHYSNSTTLPSCQMTQLLRGQMHSFPSHYQQECFSRTLEERAALSRESNLSSPESLTLDWTSPCPLQAPFSLHVPLLSRPGSVGSIPLDIPATWHFLGIKVQPVIWRDTAI